MRKIVVVMVFCLLHCGIACSQTIEPQTQDEWRQQHAAAEMQIHRLKIKQVIGVIATAVGGGIIIWSLQARSIQNLGWSCERSGGFGPNGMFPCVDVLPSVSKRVSAPILTIGIVTVVGGLDYWATKRQDTLVARKDLRELDEQALRRGWSLHQPLLPRPLEASANSPLVSGKP